MQVSEHRHTAVVLLYAGILRRLDQLPRALLDDDHVIPPDNVERRCGVVRAEHSVANGSRKSEARHRYAEIAKESTIRTSYFKRLLQKKILQRWMGRLAVNQECRVCMRAFELIICTT